VIGPPPPLLTRPRLLLVLAAAAALLAALLPEAADQPSLAGARFAYIDPGAGSFVFQALVALLAAAGVTMRMHWKRIKAYFDRTTRDERESDATDAASTDD
jgi:glutathione S-transferase